MPRLLALCLIAPAVASAAPSAIHHSGRIIDALGAPIQGDIEVTFTVHADASTASVLWTEQESVTAVDGYYSVVLGDDTAFPPTLWTGPVRWLQLTLDGDPIGPRTPIHAVPTAFHAATADSATTAVSATTATTADSATTALNATGDITPSSVDVSGDVYARQGLRLGAVSGSCPGTVPEGMVQYAAGALQVCTATGWTSLASGLSCPAGWWSVNEGKLCVQNTLRPAATAQDAIAYCSSTFAARVCTHNDAQQACGAGFNPHAGADIGWYGDHGYAVDIDLVAAGDQPGNTDDEYLTWNRAYCTSNNDGPAYHAASGPPSNGGLPYRCCR